MPRVNYNKRNKKYVYHKGDYDDPDHPAHSSNYPHFRNDWNSGRRGQRNSQRPNANSEIIRRVMFVDGPGPSHTQTVVSQTGETWMRATVSNAGSLPMEFFKESISTAVGSPIRIYNYMAKGESCTFFFKLRSRKMNESFQAIKAIVNPNTNTPIVSEVKACLEPDVPSSTMANPDAGISTAILPESWMNALRECFKERFQTTSNVLDLSSLHTDLTLLNRGYFIPLNKNIVFSSFLTILQENNARLSALNLSSNRLRNVQPIDDMKKVLGPPTYSFERIDLSNNIITLPRCLEALSNIPSIVDLDVSDNPLAGRLSHPKSGRMFESHIVKILPGLKTLNGKPVKTTVQFAIEQISNAPEINRAPRIPLPPSIQGHFGSEEIRKPLLSFLMEYFGHYDVQQRGEGMYNYYTSASTLTMTINPCSQFTGKSVLETIETVDANGEKRKIQLMTNNLSDSYFKSNRNLIRCKDETKRMELVSQGPLNIASVLGKLPPTEHVLESFCVDVIDQSNDQIILNLTGVFYEIALSSGANIPLRKVLRCFNRLMIIVAPGTKILQDNLIISNPSEPLIQRYIRDVKRSSKNQFSAGTSISSPQPPITNNSQPSNDQQTMVIEFHRQTGMNMTYSRQCLQEFGWQFEAALNGFRTMNASGSIPQIAFAPE
nr:nuclear rna export factor 1 [Hymenolepis microstoma]